MTTTLAYIQKILVEEYSCKPEQLTEDATLEQIGLDSLAMIELIFKLEETLDIVFEADPGTLKTLGDVVNFVDQCKASAATETQGANP